MARSFDVLLRFANLFQQGHRFREVFVEIAAHQAKDFKQDRVANGIEDLVRHLPSQHKLSRAKNRQMLGDIGLFHAKFIDQFAGGEFSIPEQFDNGYSSWMCEGLKNICFEATQGIGHNEMMIT